MSAAKIVEDVIKANVIAVFSKSYCPYCTRVKKALPSLNQSSIKILELDEMSNGGELQNSLAERTGQRSVPNIFINGTHVGGCDDFFAKQKSGEIEKLLKQ